jgi:FkbM family methyltransferase
VRRLIAAAYTAIARIVAGRRFDRFRMLRAANEVALHFLRRAPADVQGHKMLVDRHDTLRLYAKGIYDPVETELVHRVICRGDVVLDIGAHVGYFTLLFARLVGDEGHVYSFEPDPQNFALLQRNVELNGYSNISLFRCAVTNETGAVKLYRSRENAGDHRIFLTNGRDAIVVPAVRLDDHFRGYAGRLDFVKMDIQGAEVAALAGMSELLERTRPSRLIIEFAPDLLAAAGADPEELLGVLGARGYEIRPLDGQQLAEYTEQPTAALTRGRGRGEERFTNLLCVRAGEDAF